MQNNSVDPDAVVQAFHDKKLEEFVPVIVILSLVSLCGIVGNVFTIGFYGLHTKRTPTVMMITALAAVDLFICVILVHAIVEIGVNVYYTNKYTCKILHVLVHWAMAASALILGLISIDRFRRICRPLKKQISMVLAKRLVIGIVSFGCLLSIRDFVNFDIIQFPLTKENYGNSTVPVGHYCTTTDNPDLKISVSIFLGIDAILVVSVIVTLVVTYGNIVVAIYRAGRSSLNDKVVHDRPTTQTHEDPSSNTETRSCEYELTDDATSSSCNVTEKVVGKKKAISNKIGKTKLKKSERSITVLMLLVSVGFIVSFVPYFIIKIGVRSVKRASDLELGAGTQLGIRLVYVNSVLNPIIFCVFNPQFRRYIQDILSRAVSWRNREASSSQVTFSTGKEQLSSEHT